MFLDSIDTNTLDIFFKLPHTFHRNYYSKKQNRTRRKKFSAKKNFNLDYFFEQFFKTLRKTLTGEKVEHMRGFSRARKEPLSHPGGICKALVLFRLSTIC